MKRLPFVSVILPVFNESRALPALIACLQCQDYPCDCFEILVCDGFSNDGTRELTTELATNSPVPIRLIDNPERRSGPGRNAGVECALGEFILFIDGHCLVPDQHLIRNMVEVFEQTGADCLCRPQPLNAGYRTRVAKAIGAARASWLGHARDSLIYNMEYRGPADPASSGAMYRRAVFEAIGGYDERFDACEDVEFNVRVRKFGLRSYTDPRLAVFYEPRSTFRGLWVQMLRYGRGRIRLMRKHTDCASASQLLPAMMLVYFVLLPIAIWLPFVAGILFCVPAALLFVAIAVAAVQIAARCGLYYLVLVPLAFLCVYFGLGAGILQEALTGDSGALSRSATEGIRREEYPG